MATKLLQFFAYGHLPPRVQGFSKLFNDLAQHLERTIPSNSEKNTAIRKLLESRDAAIRAATYQDG